MTTLTTSLLYAFLFIVLYFEVFLVLTMIETRPHIKKGPVALGSKKADGSDADAIVHPSVTIVVPVFNEEKTVAKTIHSLLELN
jgi:cellulose synthase/poly-beta-1,6-N-acetylglucosamine synthase-like glycosyltransferase